MDLIERLIDEADGYGEAPVVVHDIEGLRALLREAAAEIERLRAEVAAVWSVMPSDARYLDPPDGGDVPLHEQVRRMAVDAARAELAEG